MAAIIGLEVAVAEHVAAEAASGDVCDFANDNANGQVVIAGAVTAVKRAIEIAKDKGAKRAFELPVSGAFHSDLMKPAVEALTAALQDIKFSSPTVPVVPNVTAEPTTNPEELRRLLVDQVVSPVRWSESITRMVSEGADTAYEVGPGSTLKGLVRRIDRGMTVHTAGTKEDFDGLDT